MSNIKVGVKFRPITENEIKSRQWIVNGNEIKSKNSKHKFSFCKLQKILNYEIFIYLCFEYSI